MILTDASVVIDYDRKKDAKLRQLFATLPIAVCGVTRAELLQGARDAADRVKLLSMLNGFADVPIPDSLWDAVGDNLFTLRRRGLWIPFNDVVVATVGIATGYEVWARDAHFPMMQPVLPGLRLFVEPP